MIPTHNCAGFLPEALRSVLAQDPGPEEMQIEVVDDCSTDDPEPVVREVGDGRVHFHRQPQNVGHVRNFDTCVERARGHLVHILHGDDAVRFGFYSSLERPFAERPEIGAAFCRHLIMDEQSHWQSISPLEQTSSGPLVDWFEKIAVGQRLQTPAMAVRRDVYEALGGYDRRIRRYAEDWEMWVRIAAHYPVWYEVEPLAVYRIRADSLSGNSLRTGKNVDDLLQVIEINREVLPPEKADEWSARAREACALAALRRADRLQFAGDRAGAAAQVRAAFRCRVSLPVIEKLAGLAVVWSRRALSRRASTA